MSLSENQIKRLTELNLSYLNRQFDENFLLSCADIILESNPQYASYVRDVIINYDISDVQAQLHLKEQKIIMYPDGILTEVNNRFSIKPEKLPSIIVNLFATMAMIHEFKHVSQDIKIQEGSALSILIHFCFNSQGIFSDDFYDYIRGHFTKESIDAFEESLNLRYKTNHILYPTERDAIIESLYDIVSICKEISNVFPIDNIIIYFTTILSDSLQNGYSLILEDKAVKCDTPSDKYFRLISDVCKLYKEKYGIDIFPVTKCITDEREKLYYGL